MGTLALWRWLGRRRRSAKYAGELAYWRERLAAESVLTASHYAGFFTAYFGLTPAFFAGARVLDVGCGPRGSLEWADGARLRVGVDPLAVPYRRLGTARHRMRYVAGTAEALPFAGASFNVICSFNSLDHTDDVGAAASEIGRVLAPGGTFLLLTDVHPRPTSLEPAVFSWDVVRRFSLTLLEQRHYERTKPGIYESVRQAVPFDHANPAPRYGVLSARFVKAA